MSLHVNANANVQPIQFRAGALVPFLMAGDPSLEESETLALALLDEGAAALEIGLPFSDALADGPVIQAAHERGLRAGVGLPQVFDLARKLRARFPAVPLVLFSYFNPIWKHGLDRFAREAADAGFNASLVVDLPPEEAAEHLSAHAKAGLGTVFLASPTTSPERLSLIDRSSSSFVYYVSRTGVTGTQSALSKSLGPEIQSAKQRISKPLAVGFGISNATQATEVAQLAEAVVVGSAFVALIEKNSHPKSREQAVRQLARELLRGVHEGTEARKVAKEKV